MQIINISYTRKLTNDITDSRLWCMMDEEIYDEGEAAQEEIYDEGGAEEITPTKPPPAAKKPTVGNKPPIIGAKPAMKKDEVGMTLKERMALLNAKNVSTRIVQTVNGFGRDI